MRTKFHFITALTVFILCQTTCLSKDHGYKLEPWKYGYMDIHQISTGRGNAAYLILPDGTTMLIDMGDMGDTTRFKQEVMPAVPNSSKSPAHWVADYIRHFSSEAGISTDIDFALITHFDSDHMGITTPDGNGGYIPKGIAELEQLVKIGKIVDRGYVFPTPEQVRKSRGFLLDGYRIFMEDRKERGFKDEKFIIGSDSQFKLMRNTSDFKNFKIQNIYSSGHIWTGEGLQTSCVVPGEGDEKLANFKYMEENKNSCVVNISYGDFDYHSGGDIQGAPEDSPRPWSDIEKTVGEFIGETDVILANHHAYSDAMYMPFVQATDPQVCILAVWDYYHPQPSTLHNMLYGGSDGIENQVYASGLVKSNKERLAEDGSKIKPDGHVVVRVYKGGKRFRIFVLDDRSTDYRVIHRSEMMKSR